MPDVHALFNNALSLDRLCRDWAEWHATLPAIGQTIPAWSIPRLEELQLESYEAWAAYDEAESARSLAMIEQAKVSKGG